MKKKKSVLMVIIFIALIVVNLIIPLQTTIAEAFSGGVWKKDDIGWWYENVDGTYPKRQWQHINSKWYYFDNNGYMQTGWQKVNGKWYYLESSGAMQTGWIKLGNDWYYLDQSGAMKVGWLELEGDWYYLEANGKMVTGEYIVDGIVNIFLNSGHWQGIKEAEQWIEDSVGWWYKNGDGTYPKGQWKYINGKWYHFDNRGYMQIGWIKEVDTWYYLNNAGAMHVGWLKLGDDFYYLDSSGAMIIGPYLINNVEYMFGRNGALLEPLSDELIKRQAKDNLNRYNYFSIEMLEYVNDLRMELGKDPLVLDYKLNQIAMFRAAEIAHMHTFSHTRPNGENCFTVFDIYETNYRVAGENIAYSMSSGSKHIYDLWKDSPGHYQNMINGSFRKIGVGVAKNNPNAGYYFRDDFWDGYYWVQIFSD